MFAVLITNPFMTVSRPRRDELEELELMGEDRRPRCEILIAAEAERLPLAKVPKGGKAY